MTVKITKPEINISQKLAELDKPSGVAGESMLRAETPQEQFNLIGASRKNLLYNPLFEVSQRGNFQVDAGGTASVGGVSPAVYNVDRWYSYGNGITVNTSTQFVTLPTGEKVRSMKTIAMTSSSSSFLHPAQNFPAQTWMENQEFTLSAWVRTNRPGQRLRICDTLSCFQPGPEIPDDGEWHYVTGTQKVGGGFNYNTPGFQFQAAFGGGVVEVGDYVELAKPQLELGKVATPFEYRSYNEELIMCQHFYEQIDYAISTDTSGAAAAETLICNGYAYTAARSLNYLKFNVQKRVPPTVTLVGGANKIEVLHPTSGWVTTTGFGARANVHGARLDLVHPSSLTAGYGLEVRLLSGGHIEIDAEA